ncbi:mpv17-like protein [Pollicipes pollicipes]|uniref:mpv17-like protein n=1 Tax=Pollicipes pollicipes TaxID=41117 RepID=UPI0018851D32|nr:mpv17-like protein [Pollicipes pollicipes]
MAMLRRFFKKHPLLSNAAIYGTMFVAAEVSQQTFVKKVMVKHEPKKPEPLDRAAVARYCVLGYAIAPPLLYAWYKWLDSRFVGVSARVVTKKVFLDVAVMGPIDVFIFFYSMALMEQREDKLSEIREKYVATVLVRMRDLLAAVNKQVYFWVPAQIVNFVFLPASVRVAFVGVCSFVWINILCWVKRDPPSADEVPHGEEAALRTDAPEAAIY